MARRALLVGVSLELHDKVVQALPDVVVTAVSELDSADVRADAIVCDWERAGPACCALVRAMDLRVPVIALLESRAEERVVAAMRGGASDVVISDRLSRLADIVERNTGVVSTVPPSPSMELSELRFRSLWDSDIVLITVVGADGCIVDANRAFSKLLGWTREELRHMSWNTLTPSDWGSADAAAREELLTTGAARPWEKEVLAKDGRPVPILASAVLIPGRPLQAIAFAVDLTEHKRIDRALHERVRIANATADFALALTETPSLAATLQRSCDVICSTFEVQRVELWTVEHDALRLRASSCGEAKAGDTLLPLAEQGLARTAWPARWEAQLSAADGFERYPVSMGGELLGLIRVRSDQPLGPIAHETIATIANASALAVQRARAEARKDVVEAELRQAQKLEAIGRLAGGVAHDFNNLLSVIIGYARLARAQLAPQDELTSMVAEIEAAGERAKNLTAQLLAFGNRQVLQPRVIDLDSVIGELRSILQRLLSEAIELTIERTPEPHLLYADPHQIEQVLMNLVVNSRDAMAGSGKVRVRTASAVSESGEKLVKLQVEDDGAGMDERVRARVFEPFFTTKPQGAGSGLGLSTVFGIVTQSGGSIHVESQPGRGTRFELLFPSVEGPVAAVARTPTALVMGGSETVLLCEDDRQVRAICRDTLARYGYRVLEAADAEQAIQLSAHASTLDMLLTDVVMPVMSGRQLAERVRSTRPGLPVLFMSGYMDDTVLREGVSNDGVHFLQKPIHPEALAGKVRDILDAAARRGW